MAVEIVDMHFILGRTMLVLDVCSTTREPLESEHTRIYLIEEARKEGFAHIHAVGKTTFSNEYNMYMKKFSFGV